MSRPDLGRLRSRRQRGAGIGSRHVEPPLPDHDDRGRSSLVPRVAADPERGHHRPQRPSTHRRDVVRVHRSAGRVLDLRQESEDPEPAPRSRRCRDSSRAAAVPTTSCAVSNWSATGRSSTTTSTCSRSARPLVSDTTATRRSATLRCRSSRPRRASGSGVVFEVSSVVSWDHTKLGRRVLTDQR